MVSNQKPRLRPRIVTLVALVLFVLGGTKIYRAIWYALEWDYVLGISQPLRWWFVINSSLLIAAICFFAATWLWMGNPWAEKGYWLAFLLTSILFWFEKVVFPADQLIRTGWLFSIGANLVLAALSFWMLRSHKV